MIIVEGAVYERGKRLLVKDESVQAGDGNLLNEQNIPISFESSCKQHLVRVKNNSNDNSLIRIRSNENINYDEYNKQMDLVSGQQRHRASNCFDRNTCGGSLTNLSASFVPNTNSNYFNRKIDTNTTSTHELYEYTATPFYQYQLKNNKENKDFSNGVQEELKTKATVPNFHETIELHIPIQLQVPEEDYQLIPIKLNHNCDETFRNEKQIMISHNPVSQNDGFMLDGFSQNLDEHFENHLDSLRELSLNMRQYFDERLNQFENGMNFLHHQCDSPMLYELAPVQQQQHVIQVNHGEQSRGAELMRQNFFPPTTANIEFGHNEQTVMRRKSSVTNLMYMRVVDGNLISSI